MSVPKNEWECNLLRLYIESNLNRDNATLSTKRKAFFIINLQGQVAFANQAFAELTGYEKADLITMEVKDLFGQSELNEKQSFFKERVEETLGSMHTILINKEGKGVNITISYFPIYFKGEFVGIQIMF